MTADNRLSLQQPGGGIADEQLSVAAIDPQHFKALLPGLIPKLLSMFSDVSPWSSRAPTTHPGGMHSAIGVA
jgi:hypothetical protein